MFEPSRYHTRMKTIFMGATAFGITPRKMAVVANSRPHVTSTTAH